MKLMKKSIIPALFSLLLFSCGEDDSSNEFWDEINVSANKKAFPIVFSSSEVGTCFEHGESNLRKVEDSKVQDINGSNVNGVIAFPSITDPLFTPVAEELKFVFDGNGNGTFQNFPALINDMECFNIDSLNWHQSIISHLNEPAKISLGYKTSLKKSTQTIYVKGVYNEDVSTSHSIALYSIEKVKQGSQKDGSGANVTVTHRNVLTSAITNTNGKTLSSAQKSNEFHEKFQFEIVEQLANNTQYIAVVFSLTNDSPDGVINCIQF